MLLTRALRRLRRELRALPWRIAMSWRKQRFILSCRRQGVKLVMGKGVQFFHAVRIHGEGGTITLEDRVSFAFNGGAHWLGPIGLEIRSPGAELVIGRDTTIMRETRIICFNRITIGSECAMGDGCLIIDSNAHDFSPGGWHKPDPGKPIELGCRVHLGPDVTILKGVKIGDESAISSRSVVLASLPARCVAMGNPARVFHQYASEAPAEPKATGA